jgi:hypothetical protein
VGFGTLCATRTHFAHFNLDEFLIPMILYSDIRLSGT